jgi:hypothetical protein
MEQDDRAARLKIRHREREKKRMGNVFEGAASILFQLAASSGRAFLIQLSLKT